jgi:glutaredoxin
MGVRIAEVRLHRRYNLSMKTCTKCKTAKSLTEFRKSAKASDGRKPRCKVCMNAEGLAWREAHPEYYAERYLEKREEYLAREAARRARQGKGAMQEYFREYHKKNKVKLITRAAEWKKNNPDKARATYEAYRDRTKDKKRVADVKWRVENRDRHRAIRNKRKALQRGAMPAFANPFLISEIYELASRRSSVTGIRWHVDHVVPLISKIVCGLHIETNLAVVPACENIAKSNRRWPDMP